MSPGHGGLEPVRLAASAAGMDPRTYSRFRYVTEPDGAEREIDQARESGDLTPHQAGALKRTLSDTREKVKRDAMGAKPADQSIRKKIRQAKTENQYTERQKREKAAQEAAVETNKRGKAFINALARLRSEGHVEHLDERHALLLANTVAEIVESMQTIGGHDEQEPERLQVVS